MVIKNSANFIGKKSVMIVVITIISAIVVLLSISVIIRFRIFFPTSTLIWENQNEKAPTVVEEICKARYAVYPVPDQLFPLFSPNKQYSIDLENAYFGQSKAIKLFNINTNTYTGTYFSDYSDFVIYCWAEDSSGIYVADYEPGSGSIFVIGGKSSKTSPVKKLLVP